MKNEIDGSRSDVIRGGHVFGEWVGKCFLREVQLTLQKKGLGKESRKKDYPSELRNKRAANLAEFLHINLKLILHG